MSRNLFSQTGGTAQQFLNTILGKSLTENQRKTNAGKSWSRTLFEEAESEQGTAKMNNRTNRQNTGTAVSNSDGPTENSY